MNMQTPYMPQQYAQQPYMPQQFVTPPMQQPVQQQAVNSQPQMSPQAPSEVAPQIFKSIEPQQMPVEENVVPKQQNEIIDVGDIEPSEQLTEQDLDMIQDVDIYENSAPEIVEENSYQQEEQQEDDSYPDDIHPDEEDTSEQQEENEIENISLVEEEPQDIKTKYNITEESLKEPETVPVYPANTGVKTDITFEKGDLVIHDTFGNGRVEKIINYGSKKLCSVYFEGVGRRLLDPSLSEIKKAN